MTAGVEVCFHCGLPLRTGSADRAEAYCCSGCWIAAHLAGHGEGRQSDRLLSRLVLSAFLSMGVMVFSLSLYGESWGESAGAEMGGEAAEALRGLFRLGALALTLPVLGLLGFPLLLAVVRLRRWLSAESLVLCGVGAAFAVSLWSTFAGGEHVYFETASLVLVFVTLGRWLESNAKARATRRLTRLLPETSSAARRVDADGRESDVAAELLRPGDTIRVLPGDVLPVDGIVREGRAFLDTASITGESEPRSVRPGSEVLAGSVSTDGALVLDVVASGDERVLERARAVLDQAARSRGESGRLADRVAALLLPVVLVLAAGTAVLRWSTVGPEKALLDALCVVLISCPCALGIATPLAFWIALGRAFQRGALVRGAEVVEALARTKRVFLDKTGTLTTGDFELVSIRVPGREGDADAAREALSEAAALEAGSEHPIGRAVRAAWRAASDASPPEVADFRVLPGVGVEGTLGRRRLRLSRASSGDATKDELTRVTLEADGSPVAELAFASRLRPEVHEALRGLRGLGLFVGVLTGDGPGPAGALQRELEVEVEHSLTPDEKVDRVCAEPRTAFVGDGLNDSAALSAADVGISVRGGVGRSLESASVNLLSPGLGVLPELFLGARRAVGVARENLVWAFAYNAAGLALAASGRLTPVLAAAAMAASSLFVVLNSARLGRSGPERGRELAAAGQPAVGAG